MHISYDVIIIGAGAAGLMCAATAGKRGKRVLLLDHAKNMGEKIRISGGGRCNFTNLYTSPQNFISGNPHFCVSALKRYTQHDFIALVEKYHIAYHEKTLGQLFCDGSAKQIIQMLLDECSLGGVEIKTLTPIKDISHTDKKFTITTEHHLYQSNALVIATGGKSIPKMGATGFGYEVAQKFGINITSLRPALVPFMFQNEMLEYVASLAGTAVDIKATAGKQSFKEAMLFTHRGLSGPAILQISSYWQEGQSVNINLLPDKNIFLLFKEQKQQNPKHDIQKYIAQFLPKKLVHTLCDDMTITGTIGDVKDKSLQILAEKIHHWHIIPHSTEGYRTAEVTLGGVDTSELSSKTFETHRVQGLYFIGEVVDVTGHLGGFNFQWAWSSGFACGSWV